MHNFWQKARTFHRLLVLKAQRKESLMMGCACVKWQAFDKFGEKSKMLGISKTLFRSLLDFLVFVLKHTFEYF